VTATGGGWAVSNPSKVKGDSAERALSKLISDELGIEVRRKLGAGRKDDTGDLEGVDGWTIEVKNVARLSDALRDGVDDSTREQRNARTPFGVAFIRVRGGRWYAVQSVEQWATVVREVAR
jgi:hypothetical protein